MHIRRLSQQLQLRKIVRRPYSSEKSLKPTGSSEKAVVKQDHGQKNDDHCSPGDGERTSVKVTLLAADNKIGQAAALSLKTNGPLVSEVRMWDSSGPLRGMAMDLNHINTGVRVKAYVGPGQLEHSIQGSDIVVVMGGSWGPPRGSNADLFYHNSEAVRELARAIVVAAPKALVALAVNPITPMLSFFAEVEHSLGLSCPERLVGLLSLEEMRGRSLLADKLSLPPSLVEVKLTGGGTPATLVPVLEGGIGGEYLGEESIVLTRLIRIQTEDVKEAREGGEGPDLAAGLAVADFVRKAAMGMCTDKRPTVSAMVRTSVLPGVPYLVLPVNLGPAGVEATPGVPKLSEREFRLLLKCLPLIKADIAAGETWAHSRQQLPLSLQCN